MTFEMNFQVNDGNNLAGGPFSYRNNGLRRALELGVRCIFDIKATVKKGEETPPVRGDRLSKLSAV
jgi:hypothetical protein